MLKKNTGTRKTQSLTLSGSPYSVSVELDIYPQLIN
jgi:hypothetical protein